MSSENTIRSHLSTARVCVGVDSERVEYQDQSSRFSLGCEPHEVWSESSNTFFSTEGKVTERCLGRGTAQSRWHLEKSL